jgi:hypothetical protein
MPPRIHVVQLDVEDGLVAADGGLGELVVEGSVLRDLVAGAALARRGEGVVEGDECCSGTEGTAQVVAPTSGVASVPGTVLDGIDRTRAGMTRRGGQGHGFELAVGGGVELDRQRAHRDLLIG